MLSFQIYTDSDKSQMLADYSARVAAGGGLSFGTNQHGFAALSAPLVEMNLDEAFQVYEWPGTPHAVVSDMATGVVWEGRLEDIGIVPSGVSLAALGYQRAMYDVPYTALWSKTSTAGWRAVAEEERSNARPSQYEMDNNNRLYIAPRKGETYANGVTNRGEMTYATPHGGSRTIKKFAADYEVKLPSGWKAQLILCDQDFTNTAFDATVTATGSLQTGSWDVSTTERARVIFSITNDSGSDTTITAETGDWYARLTNIRMKSTTEATVLASSIAAVLAVRVNGVNASQLQADSSLIEATSTDLRDEIYEDEYPAVILDRLALLHTAEWGVWEGRRLHFRPKGSAGRHWFVDVTQILELQRSLENIRNSAYGVYRAVNGERQRTSVATNEDSVDRYGITRRGFVNVQTTSLTEAQTHRGVWLADRANLAVRARILFERLYDAAGNETPLYALRAGDTITMRNLPPTLSTAVDRIRTFVVGETSYDAKADRIDIAPDDPVPTLVTLIAQQGAGLG